MSVKVFAYIWEYKVKTEHIDAFEHAYGPHGDWVQLFKNGDGYITSELHGDINNTNHFVTIDYWTSKEALDKFKKVYHSQFNELDKQFELYTESEKHIGDFVSYMEKYLTKE
ncbi:MAG TPA: hypothetical protein DIS90_08985 [Cytophagales bacterium]|nr:hypothetical protein [Cytophagales bacterium]